VVNYTVNGIDSTKQYNDSCGCTINFYISPDNHQFFHMCDEIYGFGSWSIDNHASTLNIIFEGSGEYMPCHNSIFYWANNSNAELSWKINSLSYSDLWITTTYNNVNYSIQLKAK